MYSEACSEWWEAVVRASAEKGDLRDFPTETHQSDHRDWSSAHDENTVLSYKGSRHGWYMAPSLLDAGEKWGSKTEGTAGVYVIQAKPSGFVKVGYSANTQKRLAELQVGCPETLTILFVIPARRAEEKRIHGEIDVYRIRGEWFTSEALSDLERYKHYL